MLHAVFLPPDPRCPVQQPSWRCFAPLVLALPAQQPDLLPYPVASGELSYTDVSGNRTVALLTPRDRHPPGG